MKNCNYSSILLLLDFVRTPTETKHKIFYFRFFSEPKSERGATCSY